MSTSTNGASASRGGEGSLGSGSSDVEARSGAAGGTPCALGRPPLRGGEPSAALTASASSAVGAYHWETGGPVDGQFPTGTFRSASQARIASDVRSAPHATATSTLKIRLPPREARTRSAARATASWATSGMASNASTPRGDRLRMTTRPAASVNSIVPPAVDVLGRSVSGFRRAKTARHRRAIDFAIQLTRVMNVTALQVRTGDAVRPPRTD
jgi:hypothetical protein